MSKMKKSLITTAILVSLTLSACGGSSGGSDDTDPVTPTPTPNTAPTDIAIDNSSVDENMAGAVVGKLSATDAEGGAMTFTVDGDMFAIDGDELKLADGYAANYEQATSMAVNVTVADADGATFSKELTIDVNDLLDTYKFNSKFVEGESSVSYTGQTARHALIAELNHYITNVLKGELEDGTLTSRQDVIDVLDKFFRTTELQYDNFPITFTDAKEKFLTDISGSHKNLVGKLAGNDEKGQHKLWNDGDFEGWGEKGSTTPEGLVDIFFGQLADNAEAELNGTIRQAVTGEDITDIYLNTNGTDLKQLIQKFLLVGITYSQATDDYLGNEVVDAAGNDIDGSKGLLTDNVAAVSGKSYSTLEHQFDEGFGYFGATVDYLEYSDNEISGKIDADAGDREEYNGKHDTDEDGEISLKSEFLFGQSVNAGKRDRATAGNTNPTDFTKQVMEAFLAGRDIINANAGMALTDDQMTELLTHRDAAVDAWERAIVATVVHYINDTRSDLDKLGTADFNYSDLAKHWSEMKGFALGIQFNPYSKISDADYTRLHQLMQDAPVLDAANVEAYKADLLAARDIIQAAMSFDAENVANW
ncbi:DUF4856 domain-containing protein [Thalassotalea euphylliae]|uniref:DUF4856 domain-containing protein n=2 Tax=Thalassotalea euphylliae TaxID=1655234 RepID=A0A3E0U3Q5_9GAMM|nr:DUF4856 domain-containing protein [Thalassotalea euphylliae]